jgi:sulfide:quinone oxidoreductase
MVKKLLVLGGGTGGLIISREVRERLGPGEVEITVVDMKDRTEFRPLLPLCGLWIQKAGADLGAA